MINLLSVVTLFPRLFQNLTWLKMSDKRNNTEGEGEKQTGKRAKTSNDTIEGILYFFIKRKKWTQNNNRLSLFAKSQRNQ